MVTTIAVMGAGSFGTAMAQVFADATLAAAATKSTSVRLWCRRPELAEQIAHDRENSSYLPAVHLPDNVEVTADPAAALDGASIVALAVPAQLLREHLAAWAPKLPGDATLLSLAKGIEIDSLMRMTEVIHDVTGRPTDQLAVLTGPNFAKEIGRREPTLAVVGCSDLGRAADVQKNCATAYFRPYINDDVVGCEIGGAAKNVIALACGIASGIGLGENAMAAIITRGLAETIRLAEAAGAKMSTMAGLAGVGDLIATCSSPQSRNRAFGAHLGRGLSLSDATAKTGDQVAEGVKSSISVHALADRLGVEMPLVAAVHGVCHQGLSVPDVIAQLFQRDIKAE